MAISGVLAFAVAAAIDPGAVDDGPIVCPLRRLTGLPCPGCGLTRSWVHLAHGDLTASVLAHPFGLLLAVGVAALLANVLVNRARGRPAPRLNDIVRRPVVVAVLVIWLAFAALRLVAFA